MIALDCVNDFPQVSQGYGLTHVCVLSSTRGGGLNAVNNCQQESLGCGLTPVCVLS